MIEKQPVNKESPSIEADQVENLRELFPQVFTEGKVDFDKLREALGDEVDSRPERYSFSWAGKRDAIRLLQTPSRATLMPAKKESVNFDETNNIFIEGDNLEVLKLLYKSYFGRVKMIYIDPPYNTGNDFVYPDNFADPLDTYLKLTGQKTAEGNLLTSNPETSGRYHSAWLSMMYPRLFIARQLLGDDGVIFVSIDDSEVHNLRMVMNEIFGEENFIIQLEWQKRYTRSNNTDNFTSVIDHIVIYQKNELFSPNLFARAEEADARYANPDNDPRGPWKAIPFLNPLSPEQRPNLNYKIKNPHTGEEILPIKKAWRSEKAVYEKYAAENRVWWGREGNAKTPNIKRFLSEVRQGMTPTNLWDHEFAGHTDMANLEIKELFNDKIFDTPKPSLLIRRMLQLATEPNDGDIILDFFAGSCSTAHAVIEQNREDSGNRRFIMVQLPEPVSPELPARKAGFDNIAEIGKERIRRVIVKLKKEKAGKLDLKNGDKAEDLGFKVFKLAESNYKPWTGPENKEPDAYAAQMAAFTDPFMPGWKPEYVLWEVAIKEGYGLNSEIIHMTGIKENSVYHVTDPDKGQRFRICLDEVLKPAAIRALALGKNDLFICRDKAMTDELVANLALQCRLKTI